MQRKEGIDVAEQNSTADMATTIRIGIMIRQEKGSSSQENQGWRGRTWSDKKSGQPSQS